MKNIILIGFMGAGKTTIGIKLSYALHTPMEDTDKMIEAKQGRSISDIFASDGEEAFRRMETDLLEDLLARKKQKEEDIRKGIRKNTGASYILSVGGGLPLREENRALLKKIGKVIYLRAKPETIFERIKNDTSRPLLRCDNPFERICQLMDSRKEKYEDAADYILDVDDKPFEQILSEISEHMKE